MIYFINNYYKSEISVTLFTNDYENIEYAIVSYKEPAVIAHEFLHLFGAWDLYITPFESSKKSVKKKTMAMKLFPNEIMAFAYRDIDSLEIGQFTRYTIGWDKAIDPMYSKLLFGKRIKPLKY